MDDYVTQQRSLYGLFGRFFAPEIIGALLSLVRPALRLTSLGTEAPHGAGNADRLGHANGLGHTGGPESRVTRDGAVGPEQTLDLRRRADQGVGVEPAGMVHLGGTPRLPPGGDWPVWKDRPLDYLGSIDFADLPRIPGLPATGMYAFYYASDLPRPWGDDPGQRGAWRLLSGGLREVVPPPGVMSYPPCVLRASPFPSLPHPREPLLQRLEHSYPGVLAVYEQLHVVWRHHVWPGDAPVHQIGGWPVLVQRPVGPDCHNASTGRTGDVRSLRPDEAAAISDRWRLLLQLDSDQRLDWHWGDPGRIYFCTRQDDPIEAAWLTLQATP
jgi:hypothetical protein